MSNVRIYILNDEMEPLPVDAIGEICIGGVGVSRGYWGRPGLTAERFVADPFAAQGGGRIYRSGDIGRRCSDGTIEFLGRNDHQVKLRGYRIELGEIEAQLETHAQVREAVVLVREDGVGQARLVAYVTVNDEAPSVERLRAHLRETLPEYMVPSALVVLDELPLTGNGKVDRRALPPPDGKSHAGREDEAPEGDTEKTLAEIWREVLSVEHVGRHDDFFELGGHSLLAVQVVARIRYLLSAELELRALFDFPTIAQLAPRVDEQRYRYLMREVAGGGEEMEELLNRIASLSEPDAAALAQELKQRRGQ